MEASKLHFLYEHHRNSCGDLLKHTNARDRTFVYILLVIAVMSVESSLPTQLGDVVFERIAPNFSLATFFNVSYASSIIWLLFLGACTRYYHLLVTIERQFDHVESLRDVLNAEIGDDIFHQGDGESSSRRQAVLSLWIRYMHTVVFPLALCMVAVSRAIVEIRQGIDTPSVLMLDIAIAFCFLFSTYLMASLVHVRKCQRRL